MITSRLLILLAGFSISPIVRTGLAPPGNTEALIAPVITINHSISLFRRSEHEKTEPGQHNEFNV